MVKERSLKKNIVLNIINTLLNIIFPLITFPYVSRILMPEGIGRIQFAQSIIGYFILLSLVGISTYGIRETAKLRNNRTKLSQLVHELLLINTIATLLTYLLFFIFILIQGENNRELLLVFSLTILFTTIGLEWLYYGLEEFTYITVRNIIVQSFVLVLLFVFVKNSEDYFNYALLLVLSKSGVNLWSFVQSRKYISFKRLNNYEFKRHIKPLAIMYAMNLTGAIYLNLDTVMLGYISGNESVGLYTSAIKINKIVLAIVLSMGNVLIPRLSFSFSNKNKQQFNDLIGKSTDVMVMVALPSIVGLSLLSKEVIILISGPEYEAATLAMIILNPIILIIGLSHLIGLQILVPMGKEKYALYSFGVGAMISFLLNAILIPKYSYNGAAITTVIAESLVTITQIYFGWEYVKDKIFTISKVAYIVGSIIIVIIILIIKDLITTNLYIVVFSVILSFLGYVITLILFKDEITKGLINTLYRKA